MKHAICIQCHDKPELINALIDYMPTERVDFFIHVDKKSDIYEQIRKKDNVFFSERINVQWGRVSQIKATLALLNILRGKEYDYVHLISGRDFIVKSVDEFFTFFDKVGKKQFIECCPLPEGSSWNWGGADRYSVYYPQWLIHRPSKKLFKFIRVLYREFVMRTKIFQRKRLPVEKFYGGSSWFSITGECAEWIKSYLSMHGEYLTFFNNTICGDELFFSTLLRYSPFKNNVVNKCLRFMKWAGSTSGGPAVLNSSDIENVGDEYVFARKFDSIETIEKIINGFRKDSE